LFLLRNEKFCGVINQLGRGKYQLVDETAQTRHCRFLLVFLVVKEEICNLQATIRSDL
jgi:hypothetical protein